MHHNRDYQRFTSLCISLIWLATEHETVYSHPPYQTVREHHIPELDLVIEEEDGLDDDMAPLPTAYRLIMKRQRVPYRVFLNHPYATALEAIGVELQTLQDTHPDTLLPSILKAFREKHLPTLQAFAL